MQIQTFKVEEWMNEYEKYCKYDLGNTTVNILSIDELLKICEIDRKAFWQNLSSKKLGYGDIKGSDDLKQGISSLYQHINPEDILPTAGAAGANHLVFYSLIEPEDNVISIIPTYQQLYSIPASFKADVKLLRLKKENNFLPDINELKRLANKKTKMICINNPNNPAGSLISEDLMNEIINIARENESYILCDEVYRGLNHDGSVTPSVSDLYEKGISTSSMSKTFSLAGVRLGWLATKDKSVIKQCMTHREYNLISCSILDEAVSAIALKNADKIINKNVSTINEHLKILDDWVRNEKHVSYVKPVSGTTAMIYYDADIKSKELCDRLAKEKGVFLTPGFCFEEEFCFRIGYCKGLQQLQKGLEIISEYFRQFS